MNKIKLGNKRLEIIRENYGKVDLNRYYYNGKPYYGRIENSNLFNMGVTIFYIENGFCIKSREY